VRLASGVVLLAVFLVWLVKKEKQELGNFPVIGKWIRAKAF